MDSFLKWIGKTPPLQILALVLAAPVFTALVVYIINAVIHPHWDKSQQSLQLEILRETIAYSFIMLLVVIAALTAGLIRGFKIGAGKLSAEIDLSDDEDKEESK